MDVEQLTACMRPLLADARLDPEQVSVRALQGGGNNRVFLLAAPDRSYLVKAYFSHPADQRDRLGAEWSLLTRAWSSGLRCIPQPLAKDDHHRLGLYEFVEGRKLSSGEISEEHVTQALEFLARLNDPLCRAQPQPLRDASEACFSVREHLAMLDQRLQRLNAIVVTTEIDRAAASFVQDLSASWSSVRQDICRQCVPGELGEVLSAEDRCISPSDFGFHNALLRPSGILCFLDFEYAGWDDPAKTVGDFFSQPAVPVPLAYFDAFAARAVAYSRNCGRLEARVRILLPLFQIKWCCIMLNEFLPDAAQRRRFADPGLDSEQRKRTQLDKAQKYYRSMVSEPWPT